MSEETISTTELGDKILLVLKTIYDPEIPVDIYELGSVSYTHLRAHET